MRREWQCPAWPGTAFLGWAKGHAVAFTSLRKLGLETPQTALPSKVQALTAAETGHQEGSEGDKGLEGEEAAGRGQSEWGAPYWGWGVEAPHSAPCPACWAHVQGQPPLCRPPAGLS